MGRVGQWRAKRTVTIRSSGGVTRAVNGDIPPEPSRLKHRHDTAENYVDGRFRAARPSPPSENLIKAVLVARQELIASKRYGCATQKVTESGLPHSPGAESRKEERETEPCAVFSRNAAYARTSVLYTEHALPAKCMQCNVLLGTYGVRPCGHACLCFACASSTIALHIPFTEASCEHTALPPTGVHTATSCLLCGGSVKEFYRALFKANDTMQPVPAARWA